MPHTLIIHFDRLPDLRLVRQLLDRLGVRYERPAPTEASDTLNWLDGLGLEEELVPMNYADMPDLPPITPVLAEAYEEATKYFGAWADEEESLEELLAMLTP
ncbi:MAG: hypothetical protein AAF804_04825 [Bacteroidota bacterium]